MRWAVGVWIAGLVLLVPCALYRLLFIAGPEEYAFLIVFPLFWVFGYWGVVGPLLAVTKAHRLIRALESARDSDALRRAFDATEGDEVVIDLIAPENRIPRWLARRICARVRPRIVRLAAERRPGACRSDERTSDDESPPRGDLPPESP